LRSDNSAKMKFSSLSLSCFWASQLLTYSTVAMMALEEVLPCTTTDQCENRLSSWVKIKLKYRDRMDVRRGNLLAFFKIKPRICKLVGECCHEYKPDWTSDEAVLGNNFAIINMNKRLVLLCSPFVALFVVYSVPGVRQK